MKIDALQPNRKNRKEATRSSYLGNGPAGMSVGSSESFRPSVRPYIRTSPPKILEDSGRALEGIRQPEKSQ